MFDKDTLQATVFAPFLFLAVCPPALENLVEWCNTHQIQLLCTTGALAAILVQLTIATLIFCVIRTGDKRP